MDPAFLGLCESCLGELRKDTKSKLIRSIQAIDNTEEREIFQAIMILLSTLGVGPNIDRLVDHTTYPREVVEPIVRRMHEAGLWTDKVIDNREWYDKNGGLNKDGLYIHAMVALGKVSREKTLNGAKYIDLETGEVVGVWDLD